MSGSSLDSLTQDLLKHLCQIRFEISMNNQMHIATNPRASADLCGSASCGGRGAGTGGGAGATECVVNDGNTNLNSDYLYIDGAFSLDAGGGLGSIVSFYQIKSILNQCFSDQIRTNYYCGSTGLGWRVNPAPAGSMTQPSRVMTEETGVARLSFVTDMM